MSTFSVLTTLAVLSVQLAPIFAAAPLYGQCGGLDWKGETTCVAGATCVKANDWYSQCLPGTASSSTSAISTSVSASSTSSAPLPTGSACNTPPASVGQLSYVGVNIAGFDFGCGVDGLCTTIGAWPPLLQYGGLDGEGQMKHFIKDDGFNTFRLPTGWQFLTNEVLGGTLHAGNWAKYDALMQACLATGAYCVVDIHNYARWNGQIIGQGGPSNEQFAALWSSIATKYASNPKIMFGIMNEPHDVPDIVAWAASVQAAVTAIRKAGATSHKILLPGNEWTSAATFVSNGSADALKKVTNLDGSTTGLIFDVHKYLDYNNSGQNAECTTNNIDSAWAPLAQWLRCNGRQAFITETGGGNTQSCVTTMCQQVAFLAKNSDVYLGYVGWSAGNFDPAKYVLNETPTYSGGVWTDALLVSKCIAPASGSQRG